MGDGGKQTRSNADIGDEIENSEVNFVYIDNKFWYYCTLMEPNNLEKNIFCFKEQL